MVDGWINGRQGSSVTACRMNGRDHEGVNKLGWIHGRLRFWGWAARRDSGGQAARHMSSLQYDVLLYFVPGSRSRPQLYGVPS